MEELEARVAALEAAYGYLSTQVLPYYDNQIAQLNDQMQDVQIRIAELESEISGGTHIAENVDKLIDILYNFSKAKYNFVEYSQAEIDFYKAMQELKGV